MTDGSGLSTQRLVAVDAEHRRGSCARCPRRTSWTSTSIRAPVDRFQGTETMLPRFSGGPHFAFPARKVSNFPFQRARRTARQRIFSWIKFLQRSLVPLPDRPVQRQNEAVRYSGPGSSHRRASQTVTTRARAAQSRSEASPIGSPDPCHAAWVERTGGAARSGPGSRFGRYARPAPHLNSVPTGACRRPASSAPRVETSSLPTSSRPAVRRLQEASSAEKARVCTPTRRVFEPAVPLAHVRITPGR